MTNAMSPATPVIKIYRLSAAEARVMIPGVVVLYAFPRLPAMTSQTRAKRRFRASAFSAVKCSRGFTYLLALSVTVRYAGNNHFDTLSHASLSAAVNVSSARSRLSLCSAYVWRPSGEVTVTVQKNMLAKIIMLSRPISSGGISSFRRLTVTSPEGRHTYALHNDNLER